MKEALDQACSAKKMLLEISQYSQGNTCVRASFLIKMQAWGLQETLAQVFSWKFYEISKNTFFTEHLRWLLLKWKLPEALFKKELCPPLNTQNYNHCHYILRIFNVLLIFNVLHDY